MQISPLVNQDMVIQANTQSRGAKTLEPRTQENMAQLNPKAPPSPVPTPEENVPRETKPEVDPKFAALSRKEKEILVQRRQLAAERKQLEEQYKPWIEAKEIATRSKLEAAKKLWGGNPYEDMTAELVGMPPQTPEQIAADIARQEAQKIIDTAFKAQQEQMSQLQQQQYDATKKQISLEIREIAQPDTFPLVNHLKGFDTVTEYVEMMFHQTGELISREAATKAYEDFLDENIEPLLKIEKVRNKVLGSQEQKPVPSPSVQTQVQQPRTLTHKTMVAPPAPKPMTSAEKRQRAIDVFYGRHTA